MRLQQRNGYSRRLSRLHAKGIVTLTLFALAESITFVNAVNLWNNHQSRTFFGSSSSNTNKNAGSTAAGKKQNHPQNAAGFWKSGDEHISNSECVSSPPLGSSSDSSFRIMSTIASSIPRLLAGASLPNKIGSSSITNPQPTIDDRCCRGDCFNCLLHVASESSVAALCARGGHQPHPVAAVILDTATVITPYNIPLNAWKIIFQVLLTALNVACWLIPLKYKRISQNKMALSLANAFSGGVFLALAFGHLIPECLHGFANGKYNEATPFLFVLTGYLLIFFVEKVAFDAHEILHEMEHSSANQHHHHNPDSMKQIAATQQHKSQKASSPSMMNGATNKASADAASVAFSASAATGRSAVILLGALAVHSVLEMMALGLANTFGDSALLTLSISLHQPAESIALLVAFLKSGLSEKQIITYLSIFSCMGPIGVGLGMLVNQYAPPIVDSIMLAVVAGTFVYVGATEVIPEEWEDSSHKWEKFASLMAGIVSILCITQYTMALGH